MTQILIFYTILIGLLLIAILMSLGETGYLEKWYQEAFGETPEIGTLCVSISGVNNCSYEWNVINDRAELEAIYLKYDGKDEPSRVNGFTINSEKKVFLSSKNIIETIIHERKHVVCNLSLAGNPSEAWYCNFKVDLEYTAQSTRPESDKIGVNDIIIPKISEKMKINTSFQKYL